MKLSERIAGLEAWQDRLEAGFACEKPLETKELTSAIIQIYEALQTLAAGAAAMGTALNLPKMDIADEDVRTAVDNWAGDL